MGVIQQSFNRAVSIAALLYRSSERYQTDVKAKQNEAMKTQQEQYSSAIQSSGLTKAKKAELSEQYVDPMLEKRAKSGDINALNEIIEKNLVRAKQEKAMKRMSYKDIPTSLGHPLGFLTRNMPAEQKAEIRKEAEPVRKAMAKEKQNG